MVSIGFGVALVPESLKAVGIRGVSFVRLQGSEPIPAAFLIWNSKRLTPALHAFIETTRETLPVTIPDRNR
jgi:DNA-binding transcriptional LysR family regulator